MRVGWVKAKPHLYERESYGFVKEFVAYMRNNRDWLGTKITSAPSDGCATHTAITMDWILVRFVGCKLKLKTGAQGFVCLAPSSLLSWFLAC